MKYSIRKVEEDGTVAIRDYDVKKCIASGEDLHIDFKGEIMTLKTTELGPGIKKISSTYRTKNRQGKDYKLYFFTWNPKTEKI